MSCAYTMRAFDTGYKTDNGKPLYYLTKQKINFIYKPISKDVAHSQLPKHVYLDKRITEFNELPCGQCEQCQAKRAKEWTERVIAEAHEWKYNVVVNLTYNDENLPLNRFVINPETGERLEAPFNTPDTFEVPTLRYEDVQDFKKRLQRYWKYHYGEDNIRFVCACEYGKKRDRPHYHIIFFNLHVRDLEDHGFTPKGGKEYLSKTIQKLWNKGWVTLGEVNQQSVQYISNYTLKKIRGTDAKEYYRQNGKEPESIKFSNHPGIGSKWLLAHQDELLENGRIYLGTNNGAIEITSNSFLDRKMALENPERLAKIKQARKELMQSRERTRALISGVDIDTQRQNDANAFHERIKKAKRRSAL